MCKEYKLSIRFLVENEFVIRGSQVFDPETNGVMVNAPSNTRIEKMN